MERWTKSFGITEDLSFRALSSKLRVYAQGPLLKFIAWHGYNSKSTKLASESRTILMCYSCSELTFWTKSRPGPSAVGTDRPQNMKQVELVGPFSIQKIWKPVCLPDGLDNLLSTNPYYVSPCKCRICNLSIYKHTTSGVCYIQVSIMRNTSCQHIYNSRYIV